MDTYDIIWKRALKARGKGWLVSFEPRPGEETGPCGFGGWFVWYRERFNDWGVLVVINSIQRISKGHE
jgi:hypothetical protein